MKYLLISLLILCSCAKNGAGDSINGSSGLKPLRSVWNSPSAPNWTLDLTDVDHAVFSYYTGGLCGANSGISWINDENTGWLQVVSIPTNSALPGDPPCSQFVDTWKYAVLASGGLELCPSDLSRPCVEFH